MTVLCLDIGGSAVKAWLMDPETGVCGSGSAPLPTHRPNPNVAELRPAALRESIREACEDLANGPAGAGWAARVSAVTVCSLRQGFVLTDPRGELTPIILNNDRRGIPALPRLRAFGEERIYEITGHWLASELTLAKLLALQTEDPHLFRAETSLLFVHDWIIHSLTGIILSEASLACAGQLANVAERAWASDLLDEFGISPAILPDLSAAGSIIGGLHHDGSSLLGGVPVDTPVVMGGGDSQFAALGLGARGEADLAIIAGSSTPLQWVTSDPGPALNLRSQATDCPEPWVSTHLLPQRWVLETNAGYPGTLHGWLKRSLPTADAESPVWQAPAHTPLTAILGSAHWNRHSWTHRAPAALIGFDETTTPADIARASAESHGLLVAAQCRDLAEFQRRAPASVTLGGGAATAIAPALAGCLDQEVSVYRDGAAAAWAGLTLCGEALGIEISAIPARHVVSPVHVPEWREALDHLLDMHDAVQEAHLSSLHSHSRAGSQPQNHNQTQTQSQTRPRTDAPAIPDTQRKNI